MCLHRCHQHLSLRVLAHLLHDHRVLHERIVRRNMRVVVLIDKRLHGFTLEHRHVLAYRITRLLVVLDRNQVLAILNTKYLDHLPVQVWQVVDLRRGAR